MPGRARIGVTAVALVLIPWLPGCLDAPPAASAPAPQSPFFAASVERTGLYGFHTEGQGLTLSAVGSAHVALFDGSDRRLGDYSLGSGAGLDEVRLDAPVAGDYVLQVTINGTLTVHAGGAVATLWPLTRHVERLLLVQVPHGPLPDLPLGGRSADEPLHVNLTRAPTSLRLLTDGTFDALSLTLAGPRGTVLAVQDQQPAALGALGCCALREIPAQFDSHAVVDGALHGWLQVENLLGSLVLEATSYSRAAPPGQAGVSTQPDPPAFTYGLLPTQPVRFQVAPGARTLSFWQQGPGDALPASSWVAVFDADDRKVASVEVPPTTVATLHVTGPGKFVATAFSARVSLGADQAPDQLGLEPLEVQTQDRPDSPAGGGGDYGQANATLAVTGTLYDIQPVTIRAAGPPLGTCPDAEALRLSQRGETLGAWGAGIAADPGSVPVGALLHDGPVILWHDGFGGGFVSGCDREGARLLSYQR